MTPPTTDHTASRPTGEPTLFVDVTEIAGGSRLVVAGEIDLATAAEFSDALTAAIEHGGNVELDLYQVSFMDSQGLAAMCGALAALPDGRTLRVFDSSPNVRRLLEVTGLDATFGTDRTRSAQGTAARTVG